MKNRKHLEELFDCNALTIKGKIVLKGGSEVFENWRRLASWQGYELTTEEFLENLKWVCEDPLTDGRLTREIGLTKSGIVKLKRLYSQGFCIFYRIDNKELWSGDTFKTPCINSVYADKDGMYPTQLKIGLSARDRV